MARDAKHTNKPFRDEKEPSAREQSGRGLLYRTILDAGGADCDRADRRQVQKSVTRNRLEAECARINEGLLAVLYFGCEWTSAPTPVGLLPLK